MMKRFIQIAALVVAVSLSVVACGGGGGGGATSNPSTSTASGKRSPLPTVVQDIEPAGVRLDMRAKNYFPSGDGDTWKYNLVQNGIPSTSTVTRSVSITDATHFLVSEVSTTYGNSSTKYARSSNGHVLGADAILGSTAPAIARSIVGSFVEYQEPFFPTGAERKLVRQGDWGADLDSDGITESFRLEYSQTLQGFEQTDTPLGRIDAAHFQTVLTFTIVPSNADYSPATSIAKEETWWAAGVGLVRATRDYFSPSGNSSTYTIELSGGTVGGKNVQDNWGLDGSVIKIALPHTSLIYDKTRNRYLATIPGSVVTNGNSVAMIDAATGAVTYTNSVGSEPSVLALSNSADFLYVGLKTTGEVIKYRMADMKEQWRIRLPEDEWGYGQTYVKAIAVSPADSDLIVVSHYIPGISDSILKTIRSGLIVPDSSITSFGASHVSFSGDGKFVYTYDGSDSAGNLRKFQVLADGLKHLQVRTTNVPFAQVGFEWTSEGIWLGTGLYQTSDLSLMGSVGTSMTYCAPFVHTAKVVCLD